MEITEIEIHPLEPFLPENARILLLGSFPPPRRRWSMEFFYPNFNNDFWRIVGLIYYNQKDYFVIPGEKRFNCEAVKKFCTNKGIAIYDSATAVIRHKSNASDKDLEIVKKTDLPALLEKIPECKNIASTGGKSAAAAAELLGISDIPNVGKSVSVRFYTRDFQFFRMPSSSRAYPAPIEKKAEFYKKIFQADECNFL